MPIKCQWGEGKGTACLERKISQCLSTGELLDTVEQLMKAIPPSGHKAAATKVNLCVCVYMSV